MADILVVDKINSYYGKSHILFDVSLTVREGETLCLMGRNGAGKSTTFKTIVMDIVPKSGKVYFKGQDITGIKPYKTARLGLGLVPEDRRIFGPLTVNENLILGKTMGKTRKGIWNLDLVYEFFPVLKDFQSRPGGTLSGGEQQRVSIARALAKRPKLLLCDEPTGALDYNTGRQILKLLQETCRKDKMTVVLITHNGAITPMADHIIRMKSGKIVEDIYNENPKNVEEIEW